MENCVDVCNPSVVTYAILSTCTHPRCPGPKEREHTKRHAQQGACEFADEGSRGHKELRCGATALS